MTTRVFKDTPKFRKGDEIQSNKSLIDTQDPRSTDYSGRPHLDGSALPDSFIFAYIRTSIGLPFLR